MADGDASLGQEIFNITMAEVETIIEPDGITDDVGWESVTLVCIHQGARIGIQCICDCLYRAARVIDQ